MPYRLRVHLFELVMTFIWFTVLPINQWADRIRKGSEEFTYEISIYQYYYLPLVGIFKFGLALGLAILGGHLWHPIFGALIGVAAYIGISGAIHIDGLMDTFDALYAWPQERKWEVMKDPHVGGIGLAGFVIYLLMFVPIFTYNLSWALTKGTSLATLIMVLTAILPRMNCLPMLATYVAKEDTHLQLRPAYPHWSEPRKIISTIPYSIWFFGAIGLIAFCAQESRVALFGALAMGVVWLYNRYWLPKTVKNLGFIAGDVFGFTICVLELLLHTLYLLLLVRG